MRAGGLEMGNKGRRLTEGTVWGTILGFSLPFLMANLLQALYGAADLFMVGCFSDTAGVSAVSTGGQMMQTITGLSVGLTTGGTVLIGKYYGAKRNREMADAVKTSLLLFGLLSAGMAGGTLCLLDPICRLMQVPLQALPLTREYLRICAYGIPFIVGYNAVSGILRGLGDSRTPLLFIAISCVLNVAADFLFVGVWRWGAPGAAAATVMAQATGLVLAGGYLWANGHLASYRRRRPRFQTVAAREMLSSGLPIALQEGLVNGSFLVITALINHMGLVASASVGVVEKLIMFSMLPTTAIASAIAAVTAQHRGAGLMGRAKRCLGAGIVLSLVAGIFCFLCAQKAAPALVGLFSQDPQVIRAGAGYLRSYSFDCILVCFVFCLNTYFSGSGHPVFPLLHSLVSTCLVRIPLSWHLSRLPGADLFPIGFAAPAASLGSLLLCVGYLALLDRGRRRAKSGDLAGKLRPDAQGWGGAKPALPGDGIRGRRK